MSNDGSNQSSSSEVDESASPAHPKPRRSSAVPDGLVKDNKGQARAEFINTHAEHNWKTATSTKEKMKICCAVKNCEVRSFLSFLSRLFFC
jgi:hypothetical protein